MLISEANVPRRGNTVTRFSSARRLIASRTGVRPMPSSRPSTSSSIGAPGGDAQRDDPVAQLGVRAVGEQLARDPGLAGLGAHDCSPAVSDAASRDAAFVLTHRG